MSAFVHALQQLFTSAVLAQRFSQVTRRYSPAESEKIARAESGDASTSPR